MNSLNSTNHCWSCGGSWDIHKWIYSDKTLHRTCPIWNCPNFLNENEFIITLRVAHSCYNQPLQSNGFRKIFNEIISLQNTPWRLRKSRNYLKRVLFLGLIQKQLWVISCQKNKSGGFQRCCRQHQPLTDRDCALSVTVTHIAMLSGQRCQGCLRRLIL